MQLPLRHKDTKIHKELIFNNLRLVILCGLVPWWQKKYFSEWAQFLISKEEILFKIKNNILLITKSLQLNTVFKYLKDCK